MSYMSTSWRFARQSIAPIASPISPIVKLSKGNHLANEITRRHTGRSAALINSIKSAVSLQKMGTQSSVSRLPMLRCAERKTKTSKYTSFPISPKTSNVYVY